MAESWKQQLATLLMALKITDKEFTGQLVINVSQGGVTDVQRVERLK